MASMKILKEDIVPTDIPKGNLTTDCYFVFTDDNQVDLARGSMFAIFDHYHDAKKKVSRIRLAEGTRNPKVLQPEV